MEKIERFVPLLGRILLSLIFVMSGLSKIGGWEQTSGYMASKGMPMVPIFLLGAIVFEVLGGLTVLLGFKAKLGATALIIFLIPTTFIFHNFWTLEGMERQMQMAMFMKNLSIMGGLLLVVGLGPGPLSFDNRKNKENSV
jgi:putative oxidoreductase